MLWAAENIGGPLFFLDGRSSRPRVVPDPPEDLPAPGKRRQGLRPVLVVVGVVVAAVAVDLPDLDLHAGDVLIFEEILGPASGKPEDADPTHRHAVRLSGPPEAGVDPANNTDIVQIYWYADDALSVPFGERLSKREQLRQPIRNGGVVLVVAVLGPPVEAEAGQRQFPVRVAEEMAWLDCLSGGRLEMGLVKGAPYEIAPANSNPARLMRRYWEAHDLILKALSTTTGPFSWEGEFFQYRAVNIWPRPIQQPTPPVWMTGMSVETGIAAAEDPVLMAEAMKHAVIAGRHAYLAGRMQKKLYATASSPLEGVVR